MENYQNIPFSWPVSEELFQKVRPWGIEGVSTYADIRTEITELKERIKKLENKEQEVFPIEFLESEKLVLKQPITLRASYSEETASWVVDHFELNIYGEGRDIDEAVKDFKITLEETYFDLKEDKDKLSPPLQKEWELLNRILEEK